MNRSTAVLAVVLVISGCSKRNHGPGTDSGSGSGGSAANIEVVAKPPVEDMANIPAGRYNLSDPVFAPDSTGACPPETLAKVEALAKQTTWPDRRQDVAAFAIDKRPVSCAQYDACVAGKVCPRRAYSLCPGKRALVPVKSAIAYCRWRGAQLPTFQQWQAAVRGPTGKLSAPCDAPQKANLNYDDDECTITNDAGVTTAAHQRGRFVTEFTRTPACWPVDPTEYQGPHAIVVMPRQPQLFLFSPYDVDPPRPPWVSFRCVREAVAPVNP